MQLALSAIIASMDMMWYKVIVARSSMMRKGRLIMDGEAGNSKLAKYRLKADLQSACIVEGQKARGVSWSPKRSWLSSEMLIFRQQLLCF